MKIQKNICSGCDQNFLNETLFYAHRVGTYNREVHGKPVHTPIGQSPRRCLTEQEMRERGWQCQELGISERREDKPVIVQRRTWFLPGQLEARERNAEHMMNIQQTRHNTTFTR